MAQPKKKLKTWCVSILRERAQYLGNEWAAGAAAVARFELDKEQRKRQAVRELD